MPIVSVKLIVSLSATTKFTFSFDHCVVLRYVDSVYLCGIFKLFLDETLLCLSTHLVILQGVNIPVDYWSVPLLVELFCWAHITSLTPPLLIEVFVPNQDSQRSCICVLGTWFDLFLQFFYWNLELVRHRGTFIFFSFICCSFIIVKRIFVMNNTPNTFHIEVSIMILITIMLKTYNIS